MFKLRLRYILYIACLAVFTSCRQGATHIDISNMAQMDLRSSTPYNKINHITRHCSVTITDSLYLPLKEEGSIHLRGNYTANQPKRPFLLKLNHEREIGAMPAARSWVLLANYFDRSMLRNALAFRIAEDSKLDWTPHYQFVELYFNDEHKGTYQVCEKVQVHPNRLQIPTEGWLIEVDARVTENDMHFRTPHMENAFRFHMPDDSVFTPKMSEIAAFVNHAEEVLFSATFADSIGGWRQFLEEESWIDWYIINEIAKNNDAVFFSSCFMHLSSNGKIAVGPIWDFDLAFGNTTDNNSDDPHGWYVSQSNWYTRLFEDPAFAAAVQKSFEYFYEIKNDYFLFVRRQSDFLRPHAQANEYIWHTFGRQFGICPTDCLDYDTAIEELIVWLDERLRWIKEQLPSKYLCSP